MYHLKAKDKCEYSGLESYVADQLKVESIDWIPIFNAISLEEHTKSDENYILTEHMSQKVEELKKNPYV